MGTVPRRTRGIENIIEQGRESLGQDFIDSFVDNVTTRDGPKITNRGQVLSFGDKGHDSIVPLFEKGIMFEELQDGFGN